MQSTSSSVLRLLPCIPPHSRYPANACTSTISIVKVLAVMKAFSVSRPFSSMQQLLGLLSMCLLTAASTPADVPVSLRLVRMAGDAVAAQPIPAISFSISMVAFLS